LSGNVGGNVDTEREASNDKIDTFDYCWKQSKLPRTQSKPIPGHPKSKSGSSGSKSPRSPRSPRSMFSGQKSPKTPPNSSTSLVGMSDDDLKRLKEELIWQKADLEDDRPESLGLSRKESQVKFNLDDDEAK
jgi:hypothetical protein